MLISLWSKFGRGEIGWHQKPGKFRMLCFPLNKCSYSSCGMVCFIDIANWKAAQKICLLAILSLTTMVYSKYAVVRCTYSTEKYIQWTLSFHGGAIPGTPTDPISMDNQICGGWKIWSTCQKSLAGYREAQGDHIFIRRPAAAFYKALPVLFLPNQKCLPKESLHLWYPWRPGGAPSVPPPCN